MAMSNSPFNIDPYHGHYIIFLRHMNAFIRLHAFIFNVFFITNIANLWYGLDYCKVSVIHVQAYISLKKHEVSLLKTAV